MSQESQKPPAVVAVKRAVKRLKDRISWRWVAAVFVFMMVVALGGVAALVAAMPDDDAYVLATGNLTTQIFDRDGELVSELYWENRQPVDLQEVPEHTRKAFIAIEDVRFDRHVGVDLTGIARAAIHNMRNPDSIQGGSTITQQLARNAFDEIGYEQTMQRKIQEAMVAVSLERRYTKDEILEAYLNQIYLGKGAYGLGAASQVYFGKDVSDLTLAESALLAALPVAPGRFAPFSNPDSAQARQRLVLDLMEHQGWADPEDAEEARQTPLSEILVDGGRVDEAEHPHPWFVDEVQQRLVKLLTEINIGQGIGEDEAEQRARNQVFTGGLRVETTLDREVQTALEDAVAEILDPLDPLPDPDDPDAAAPLQVGAVLMEPDTGYIRGLIGGREHPGLNAFIRATQAKRQPGSAFKPVIAYGPALEAGHTTATVVDDSPFVSGDWAPRNVDHRYLGLTTYREAVRRSVNIPAVRVLQDVGVDTAIAYAQRLGIGSLVTESDTGSTDRNLATALGGLTDGVIPLELTRAYAVFANEGIGVEPIVISRITGPDGRVILEQEPVREDLISAQEAYIMTDMLRSSVRPWDGEFNDSSFTGRRAVEGAVMGAWDVGGKTGTTDDTTDIWFVGYTPKMVGTVWMGYDADQQTVRLNGVRGFGGLWPTMVWNRAMTAVHRDLDPVEFERPDDIVEATICIKSGLLPESECGSDIQREELFVRGTEPDETGEAFVEVEVFPLDSDTISSSDDLLEMDPMLRHRPYLLADDACPPADVITGVFLNRHVPEIDLVREFRELAYEGDGSLMNYFPADARQALPVLSCSDAPELVGASRSGVPDDAPTAVGPEEGESVTYSVTIYHDALTPEEIHVYVDQTVTLELENLRAGAVDVVKDGATTLALGAGESGSLTVSWDEPQSTSFVVTGEDGPDLELMIHVATHPDDEDDEEENGDEDGNGDENGDDDENGDGDENNGDEDENDNDDVNGNSGGEDAEEEEEEPSEE